MDGCPQDTESAVELSTIMLRFVGEAGAENQKKFQHKKIANKNNYMNSRSESVVTTIESNGPLPILV